MQIVHQILCPGDPADIVEPGTGDREETVRRVAELFLDFVGIVIQIDPR